MENIIFSLEDNTEKNTSTSLDYLNTFLEANAIEANAMEANAMEANAIEANAYAYAYDLNVNVVELENYYRSNYNVKSLQQILQYYGIPKKNMVKDEMVQRLLFYEMSPENRAIVLRRMRLWKNMSELKTDAYFAKFIHFNL